MTELPIVVNMTVDASRTEYDLTAESNLEEIELLNDTVIETGGSHVPVYEGPYTVTASAQNAVTLDTNGKKMTNNVTVTKLTAQETPETFLGVTGSGLITAETVIGVGTRTSATAITVEQQLPTQARATITPTTSEQIAVARGKYTTGVVKVRAIPTGTRGTPTATKGTVSNHSVSVTPSVTNTTGYIEGGTINGTAVSVSASELVSGSLSITTNNTYDVTNYASVVVNVSGGGGVTVEELNVTANGTYTAPTGTAYSPVTVAVYDQYATIVRYQGSTDLPNVLHAYYPKLNSLYYLLYNVSSPNVTDFTIKSDAKITTMQGAFQIGQNGLNPDCVITLDVDLSSCTNYNNAFAPGGAGRTIGKTIIGNIDFTSATSVNNMFQNNRYLETITFVPNTLAINLSMANCLSLSNASLVSVANCLKSGSHTLTLNATPKANLPTIMGTVSNNGTYDIFTEDAQGQTTLLSFITTTKGWTVA